MAQRDIISIWSGIKILWDFTWLDLIKLNSLAFNGISKQKLKNQWTNILSKHFQFKVQSNFYGENDVWTYIVGKQATYVAWQQ